MLQPLLALGAILAYSGCKGLVASHFEPLQSVPKNYSYPFAESDRIIPLVLGAHDSLEIGPLEIPKSSIRMSGQYGVYYGWIVYKDVFEATALHLTEFCMEMGLSARLPSNGPVELKSLARYSLPELL